MFPPVICKLCSIKHQKKASRVLTFEPKSVSRILVSVHFFLEQVFVLCKGAMRAL